MSRTRAFRVRTSDLPEATKKMTYNPSGPPTADMPFSSKVVAVFPPSPAGNSLASIVIVEMQGDYPYITEQWNPFIVEAFNEI